MIFSCDHRSRSQRSRSQRQTKDLSHKLYDILQKKKISARMSSMKQIDLFTCHSPCRLQLPPLNFSSPLTPSLQAAANTYRFDSYEPRTAASCSFMLLTFCPVRFVPDSWKILILCTALLARLSRPAASRFLLLLQLFPSLSPCALLFV